MPDRKDRVIIDTNLWVSFLITKDFTKLDKLLAANKMTLVLSQELVDEFVVVSQRSKFQKYFSLNDIEKLLLMIRNRADLIEVTSAVKVCRDAKDDFLLSLSMDGKASHLITGDKDLLELKRFRDTVILTMTEYFEGK
jgi:putative PIN family toxin of toxin-antitoxin system